MAIALEKCGTIKINHWLKDNLSVANIVAGIAKIYKHKKKGLQNTWQNEERKRKKILSEKKVEPIFGTCELRTWHYRHKAALT